MDIKLTSKTSGWVAVENAGGRNSVKTAKFLQKQSDEGSFSLVCFGDKGYAGASTYALRIADVGGFQDYAHSHGLKAMFADRGAA